jgi:hypothetical protein
MPPCLCSVSQPLPVTASQPVLDFFIALAGATTQEEGQVRSHSGLQAAAHPKCSDVSSSRCLHQQPGRCELKYARSFAVCSLQDLDCQQRLHMTGRAMQ